MEMVRSSIILFSLLSCWSLPAAAFGLETKQLSVKRRRNPLRLLPCGPSIRFDTSPIDNSSVTLRGGAANVHDPAVTATDQKESAFISLSLFVTYLTVMGAKCALPSTLSSITSANSGLAHYSTNISRQDVISRLLALSTLSIAVGKLALGPIIDSIGGVKSLQIALTTLLVCLGCIGLGPTTCPTLTALTGYWIIVDFAFSSCWAACVKTIRDYMDESRWSKEIGKLAMAARTGNAASFAFFAWLLQMAAIRDNAVAGSGLGIVDTDWRWVFRASSVIQLIPLALLHFSRKQSSIRSNDGNDTTTSKSSYQKQATMKNSLVILAREARTSEFWLHLFTRTIMMVLISFLLFIPSYMNQCYAISPASSARVGSLFAVGCLTSVMTLSEKVYPASSTSVTYKHKSKAMFGLLSVSTICLALQYAFLRGRIHLSPTIGSLLMFIWGFALSIPFYLPASMFALKRGKEGSATITDAFDVSGFGLLAIFNSYVARILNAGNRAKAAWSPIFLWMLGGSAISMVTMFFAVRMEGMRNDARDVD
ncbi:hypothetical protein ACHAXN_006815 [Cyclotella atomus]